MEIKSLKNVKLFGFNNLTKTLSFNLYDICYAQNPEERKSYIEYIDEEYNAQRLTNILTEVANIIGANILNIAQQDYEPQGSSVTMLISEEFAGPDNSSVTTDPTMSSVVTTLDKSHLTVHTYPESHPQEGISTFRADIDVSTCGIISPLKALNYLIDSFYSDIITLDYRVRGFTRDIQGKKLFIDHKINSIQNFISKENKQLYEMIDVNVYQENIFHTKMNLREFDLDHYLFATNKDMLTAAENKKIQQRLKKEMSEIFYGRNISRV